MSIVLVLNLSSFCSYVESVGWYAKLVNEPYPWIERQIVHQLNLRPWQKTIRDSVIKIGISLDNGFRYVHLYGTKVSGTIFDRFCRRHTAAELLASANPEKLRVLVHATVQKIEFDTTGFGLYNRLKKNKQYLTTYGIETSYSVDGIESKAGVTVLRRAAINQQPKAADENIRNLQNMLLHSKSFSLSDSCN